MRKQTAPKQIGQYNQLQEWMQDKADQEFPQYLGALGANPFAFSVLLFAKSGIARFGLIGPETSLTY